MPFLPEKHSHAPYIGNMIGTIFQLQNGPMFRVYPLYWYLSKVVQFLLESLLMLPSLLLFDQLNWFMACYGQWSEA